MIVIIVSCLFQSCKTYNYTYQKKETSVNGNLVSYYNPKIEEKYSIVPYVSVLGLGIGGGYLLGNHVHDNMVSVGSSKDTAETSRNLIYLLGAFTAGYGFYYLYNDSSAKKTNYVNYNRQEISEWYANVVDFEKYRLLGHSKGWINVINDNNINNLKTGNYKELLKIYKSFVRNSDYSLRDSIIVSSFELLPEKYHYSLYKATGSQYDIYLSSFPNYLDEFIELISYANAVKKTNIKNRDRYLSNVAEKTYKLLKETKDTNIINKWMKVFKEIENTSINIYKQKVHERIEEIKNEEKTATLLANKKKLEREKENIRRQKIAEKEAEELKRKKAQEELAQRKKQEEREKVEYNRKLEKLSALKKEIVYIM